MATLLGDHPTLHATLTMKIGNSEKKPKKSLSQKPPVILTLLTLQI